MASEKTKTSSARKIESHTNSSVINDGEKVYSQDGVLLKSKEEYRWRGFVSSYNDFPDVLTSLINMHRSYLPIFFSRFSSQIRRAVLCLFFQDEEFLQMIFVEAIYAIMIIYLSSCQWRAFRYLSDLSSIRYDESTWEKEIFIRLLTIPVGSGCI